jgi:hypothetical protein
MLSQCPVQLAAAGNDARTPVETAMPATVAQRVVAGGSATAGGQLAAAIWKGAVAMLQQQMPASTAAAAATAAATMEVMFMPTSTQGELHHCFVMYMTELLLGCT